MKKIIGLIMIAGISYGASVVTPPGIQVNGLATNNNVMVYSNGMLLDSGVAPTNLVSVTNLTADIEALSATNAAQDALIAGNLYADGTTNKTLIDAAISSAATKTSSNGVTVRYQNAFDAITNLVAGDSLTIHAGTWYATNGIIATGLSNVTIDGGGNATLVMLMTDKLVENTAYGFSQSTNLTIRGLTIVAEFADSFDAGGSEHGYNFVASNSKQFKMKDCTLILDNKVVDLNSTYHLINFVNVGSTNYCNLKDVTSAVFNLDGGSTKVQHAAFHGSGQTDTNGIMNYKRYLKVLEDCYFITTGELETTFVTQPRVINCWANASSGNPLLQPMSFDMAVSKLPYDYRDHLHPTNCYSACATGYGDVEFWCVNTNKNTDGIYDVVLTVNTNQHAGSLPLFQSGAFSYQIEIIAQFKDNGSFGNPGTVHYDLTYYGKSGTMVTNIYENTDSVNTRITFDSSSFPHQLKWYGTDALERGNYLSGTYRFTPLRVPKMNYETSTSQQSEAWPLTCEPKLSTYTATDEPY